MRAALETLARAIQSLGNRTGERASTARAWLLAHHARINAALECFDSLGPTLDGLKILSLSGPAASSLRQRYDTALDGVLEARRKFEEQAAARDILDARDTLDYAEAELREVCRDALELVKRCAFPALPDFSALQHAESDNANLIAAIKQKRPAKAMHLALDQGARASVEIAHFWAITEPATTKENDSFTWRWSRFKENA